MTRSIEDSPLVERTLLIQGHVSDATRRDLARGLPARIAGNEAILFVGYNYADVPVGSSFDCCYMSDDESLVRYVRSELVAVTQQFAEPWSEIPHGWRTIVVLAFHDAIPDLVAALPQEDDWSISDQAADLVAKDLASATATASGCRRRPAPCVPGWCSRGGLSTVAPTPGRRHVGALPSQAIHEAFGIDSRVAYNDSMGVFLSEPPSTAELQRVEQGLRGAGWEPQN